MISNIRRCRSDDAPRIAAIYNQAILGRRLAAPDPEPVTVESRIEWIAQHQDPYPACVWESPSAGVMGWAALNPFSVRPDWTWMTEGSIYVDQEARHGVIAAELGKYMESEARRLKFRIGVAVAFRKNTPMLRSAQAFGFRPVAELRDASYFRGCWETEIVLVRTL